MSGTYQFDLPLIAASQSQKHVTVNEALNRLDILTQLRFVAMDVQAPPSNPSDSEAYLVGTTATDEWFGQDGQIAIFSNGGWVFQTPKTGWRAHNEEDGGSYLFLGQNWARDVAASGQTQALVQMRVVEFDHTLSAGASSTTGDVLPSHSVVLGVTARVIEEIQGATTTGWSLGVSGASDRYGSGLGLALNSYALGLSGQPQTYYQDTPLEISAEGGDFTSGKIRIAMHFLQITPPSAI